jgi:hypothetical protein
LLVLSADQPAGRTPGAGYNMPGLSRRQPRRDLMPGVAGDRWRMAVTPRSRWPATYATMLGSSLPRHGAHRLTQERVWFVTARADASA